MNWLTSPAHHRWLESETDRLLRFGAAAATPAGFGWLDEAGHLEPGRPTELWITCRMTHVYALGALLGRPGAGTLADHGVAALTGAFHDTEHGGWYAALGAEGPVDQSKSAYGHAFVILAASSAAAAGRPGARELLDEALAISARHFWDEAAGMVVECWDRTFTELEAYRGVNANMHTVEAYLAAADVTGEASWRDRASRITERVLGFARANAWRIPEHFDMTWRPLLDYNSETPAHPFRPYGATVGHWLEWARLALQVAQPPSATATAAAVSLFDAAVAQGWAVDGAPGFVYTVDWDGAPVVRERMHWVLCEGLGAAAALHAVTDQTRYADWYRTWWDYAAKYLIDPVGGSWWHELDPTNQVSRTVWSGKADLYHAVQATLIPRLPVTSSLATALAQGWLR